MGRVKKKERWIVNNETGCWEWILAKNSLGYPMETITISRGVYRHGSRAHRNMWTKTNGPIPAGMYVDHKCKNKGCVNPKHLQLLTHTQNLRRSAKLSPALVRRAKAIRGLGIPWSEIPRKIGAKCDPSTIRSAVLGRTWTDIQ